MQSQLFPAGDAESAGKRRRIEPVAEGRAPLAARMRPAILDELLGQSHLIGEGTALRTAIERDSIPSLVLWGPPGSGKTSLARLIAAATKANFCAVSAVTAGVAELRRIIEDAQKLRRAANGRTILFIDEIHRFNKAQQDVILPWVEDGVVTLIGATTENPSFEINSALLSRCRVFTLRPLGEEDIREIVRRAMADTERGLGQLNLCLSDEALEALAVLSDGDARVALNSLELAAIASTPAADGRRQIDLAAIQDAVQRRAILYDKHGEGHYDTISALHKSVRDSDPDATLYWLGRVLEAGEDALYIARRLVRAATEDVGLADPHALQVAMAAQQAVHFLGMPEGNLALAEAAVYLALAPKSNALYRAYGEVQSDVQTTRNEPVPLAIRNAVTGLMKNLGYGKGYRYAHDHLGGYEGDSGLSKLNENLPPSLKDRRYYQPSKRGFEAELRRRLVEWGRREP